MILRRKNIPLSKPLFLLTVVSALVLSTTVGYCADERPDPALNISHHHLQDLSPKQEALVRAVKEGDLLTVKRLINREKIDKDTQEPDDGNSLLHIAIQAKKDDIFAFLLKINCDVDRRNRYGETPLHEAASIGNKAMLDSLLEEDTARVNTQDKDRNTAFHVAIYKKNLACVSSFMDTKGFDYNLKNKKGFSVVDLLSQQVQGGRGDVDLTQELKTILLTLSSSSAKAGEGEEKESAETAHDTPPPYQAAAIGQPVKLMPYQRRFVLQEMKAAEARRAEENEKQRRIEHQEARKRENLGRRFKQELRFDTSLKIYGVLTTPKLTYGEMYECWAEVLDLCHDIISHCYTSPAKIANHKRELVQKIYEALLYFLNNLRGGDNEINPLPSQYNTAASHLETIKNILNKDLMETMELYQEVHGIPHPRWDEVSPMLRASLPKR
ncbi:MAG: hypothetical protein K0R52_1068 [Alphaproteobacteria bacterium]|jgi:hypothetical protein|nr:hypothetical protein [Alphaproteobacteria bacterium]